MKKRSILICLLFLFASKLSVAQHLFILGTAQDGGYPHIGCEGSCCTPAWTNDSLKQFVVSLALADPHTRKWWLFEATPDIREQLHYFAELTDHTYSFLPDGIFISHAHIGHYTGLMQLGREAFHSKNVPVYVLPRLKAFLENNGPWNQLVKLNNIVLVELKENAPVSVANGISVNAFFVPHRDEYSETAGFKIITPVNRYLFIPDIDKWSRFEKNIVEEVKSVDLAFLDATFYSGDELPNRNLKEVPHPLVTETMELFRNESPETKRKIYFIHFNHTNPLLFDKEKQAEVQHAGFQVARQSRSVISGNK